MRDAAPLAQRLAEPIERQQAAARGAVMAGAEGERRLDLDADAVGRDAGAIMRAVHDEAAGRDRRQSGEASRDPVLRRDALEAERLGGRGAGRGAASARSASSSGGARKWIATRQRPRAGIHKADGDIRRRQSSRQTRRRPARAIVHRLSASQPVSAEAVWNSLTRSIVSELVPAIHTARAAHRVALFTRNCSHAIPGLSVSYPP